MSDNAPDSAPASDSVLPSVPSTVEPVSPVLAAVEAAPVESLEKALGLSDGQQVVIWPKGDGGLQIEIPGYIVELTAREVGSAGNDLRSLIIARCNEKRGV